MCQFRGSMNLASHQTVCKFLYEMLEFYQRCGCHRSLEYLAAQAVGWSGDDYLGPHSVETSARRSLNTFHCEVVYGSAEWIIDIALCFLLISLRPFNLPRQSIRHGDTAVLCQEALVIS